MKVILQADIKGQGKKGQMVDVSDGYARNYLIPRNLAVEANAANVNVMKERQASAEHKRQMETESANETAQKLSEITVVVKAKGGAPGGRLFGSITTKEIADSLKEQHNITVDRRKISLSDPIKVAGIYDIPIKLFAEIVGTLHVEVQVVTH